MSPIIVAISVTNDLLLKGISTIGQSRASRLYSVYNDNRRYFDVDSYLANTDCFSTGEICDGIGRKITLAGDNRWSAQRKTLLNFLMAP